MRYLAIFAIILGLALQTHSYVFNQAQLLDKSNNLITDVALNGQGVVWNDYVWFVGTSGICNATLFFGCTKDLYRSDLSPNGTTSVFKLGGTNYTNFAISNTWYVLSNTTLVFSLNFPQEVYSIYLFNATTDPVVTLLLGDNGRREYVPILQYGSRLFYSLPVQLTSNSTAIATIQTTDGSINGTRNVTSYNINIIDSEDPSRCAPYVQTAIGNSHFVYLVPICTDSNSEPDDYQYYISDGTLNGTRLLFNSTEFSLLGNSYPFTANNNDYAIIENSLYGVNGFIGNITFGDNATDSDGYSFVQVGQDIFFVRLDANNKYSVYKLSSPYTTAQLWVDAGSRYDFDGVFLVNGSLWGISFLLSNGSLNSTMNNSTSSNDTSTDYDVPFTVTIVIIDTNQSNTVQVLYTLPAGAVSISSYWGTPRITVTTEGLVVYQSRDISMRSYRARLYFVSFADGVITPLLNFTYIPNEPGISAVSTYPLELRGTLFYVVSDYSVSYPIIASPCGDQRVQYPETCDGNLNSTNTNSTTNSTATPCPDTCAPVPTLFPVFNTTFPSTSTSTGTSTGNSTEGSTGDTSTSTGSTGETSASTSTSGTSTGVDGENAENPGDADNLNSSPILSLTISLLVVCVTSASVLVLII